jgi:hypothetical protein
VFDVNGEGSMIMMIIRWTGVRSTARFKATDSHFPDKLIFFREQTHGASAIVGCHFIYICHLTVVAFWFRKSFSVPGDRLSYHPTLLAAEMESRLMTTQFQKYAVSLLQWVVTLEAIYL